MTHFTTHPNEGKADAETGVERNRVQDFFFRVRTVSSAYWHSAIAMLLIFVACLMLQKMDARQLGFESVWVKPAKFHFSIAVQLLTVAWGVSLLPAAARAEAGLRRAMQLLLAAGWLELLIITTRAGQGVASHFNRTTAFDIALYAVMGLGAVSMTVATGYIGLRIWRHRQGSLMREAAGLGFMLGAMLATLTAGYMSSLQGHGVNLPDSGAAHLPLFHWSTTGGDLRVAHFIGLHAMQALPFVALAGWRWLVWAAALALTGLTAAAFIQALMGQPLLAMA